MRLSAQGAAFIRKHEGFRSAAYRDPVGIVTIGIGFTWASQSFKDWWAVNRIGQTFDLSATMTAAEADSCLIYLCDAEYGAAVNRFLNGVVVEQHVFDAMVSMVFNCGPGSLKWQWAQHIKAGNISQAAEYWRTTATKAKGKELAGLVKRRADEADLALNGYAGYVPKPRPPVDVPAPETVQKPITYGTAPVPKVGWLDVILAAISTIIKGWKR